MPDFRLRNPEIKTPIGAVMDYFGWTPEDVRNFIGKAQFSVGDFPSFMPRDPKDSYGKIVDMVTGMIPYTQTPEEGIMGMLPAKISFSPGEFVKFTSKSGKVVQGKVRDFDPHAGKVWIFHPESSLWDSPEAASTTVDMDKVRKLGGK